MTAFVALLRAVNVGGTGKLPMTDLKAIGEACGFGRVRTYIASGNLVFESGGSEAQVKAALDKALADYAGKPVGVMIRTAAEMAEVLAVNPFPDKHPARIGVIFLNAPPAAPLVGVVAPGGEDVRPGKREIYVYYPDGMGRSKAEIPATKDGTTRNINTVAKLAEIAAAPRADVRED